MRSSSMLNDVKSTARLLFVFAIAMFGFGYALVPLYDVFCEVVGLNGKTGQISQSQAIAGEIDWDRFVTVEFDTNINDDLPWTFEAEQYKTQVHPGEIGEMMFVAHNISDREITGRAVPSVAPTKASLFFNKTECFCFTEQVLAPGESKAMPVRFVVDADLPEKITMMTLSYTFFEVPPDERKGTAKKSSDNSNNS